MQTINEDIKNGTFKPVYLLYGEEAFLKQSYKKKLRAAISGDDTMNYNYFEGKGLDVNELISLAECENRSNIKKVYGLMGGIIDVMAAAFIFLPLYGKPEGGHIYHVNLLSFTDTTKINLWIYWGIFCFLIVLGIMRLILTHYDKEAWLSRVTNGSVALSAAAICSFAAAREPYVTVLMFLFFVWKITLLYYIMNRKQHQAKTS